ncbi:helix-turn-helix domain-containing protein [Lentzea sp. HUAS12]|uniref:ATP-binding protein n=1 Tax=Lentzea sp. HUAS12 TaxID=2951806 RepID=UPI00209FEF36|nr:helix-turn-helix domain-containing protein [Lentzea sp. HUAS12]USX56440.1 helix-turn-helix domain-containing protein [Lentzea sp. HUAS12]
MSGSRHTSAPTFGQQLRLLRTDQRKSLAELSADSNVSRSYLGNLEHDRSVPGPEIAAAIDAALSAGGRLAELAVPRPRTRAARDRVRPDQLPVAIRGFVPRNELIKEAEEALATHAGVIAFDGPAGVGKTAFAVTWAHSIADAFPDGVLFADLRGYAADPPEDPAFVLGGFLRSLGVASAEIPSDLPERAALYRTLLAGTRTLVVLDNAVDDEQVRQLLPGSSSSLAVITSRNRLSGVVVREGAVRITLQPMTSGEAHELLRSVVGPHIDTDLESAQVIADRSGRLPLALRIAAERASRWLNTPLRTLAEELARRQPLDVFAINEALAVRTVLSYSHDALPRKMSDTFRLLGLHPGGPVRIEAAAALMDQPPSQAQGHLSALSSVHLLDQTADDRFVMHDLVHSYALELAREHNSHQDNVAALERLVCSYVTTGAAATRILWPSRSRSGIGLPKNDLTTLVFRSPAQALHWFEDELRLLVQLVRCGARWNVTSVAYLPVVINEMLSHRRAWSWWMPALRDALAMARQGQHRDAESWILVLLGDSSIDAGDAETAAAFYREAMTLHNELSDRGVLAVGHVGLGKASFKTGDYHAAIAHCENARKISAEVGDMWQHSVATAHLAMARSALGMSEDACALLGATRVALSDTGDLLSSGRVAVLQARLAESAGAHELAVDLLDEALRTFGRAGDVWSQANIFSRLGDLHADRGDHRGARRARAAAAELLTGNIEPAAARLREGMMSSIEEQER